MPNIIIHAVDGTFDPEARTALTTELTNFALDCETLPKSPFLKSTVWTYFSTHSSDAVFMGGAQAYLGIVSAQVFVIAGGLDEGAKKRLIKGATEILGRHSAARGKVPVYIDRVAGNPGKRLGLPRRDRRPCRHAGIAAGQACALIIRSSWKDGH